MDVSPHISGMLGNGNVGRLCRFRCIIAGTLALSACIAAPFPGRAFASIAPPGPTCITNAEPYGASVFLVQRDNAVASANAADQDTDPDGQNSSVPDSKTTPAESESDKLETFTPSETIDADQGVDFPYDI